MLKVRVSHRLLCAILPVLIISIIASAGFSVPARLTSPDDQEHEPLNHGFDLANLDRSCKPCDDFNKFADGGWKATHPIPAAYPAWGSLNALSEQNNEKLRGILQAASQNSRAPKGGNIQKIGDFYYSGMDEKSIESEGIKPLAPEFERIAGLKSPRDLRMEIVHLQQEGVAVPFRFSSDPDFKDSSTQIAVAGQGGLGLPDRDYYLKTDPTSEHIREEYDKHMAKMFELLGDDTSRAEAETRTVVSIETGLAKASMTRVQMRDPDATYHKLDLEQLKMLTPDFSWPEYFTDLGLTGVKDVDIAQPDFFKEVDHDLTAIPLDDWKTYFRWHLIAATAPFLDSKFVDEDFNFSGKVLTGTQEIQPRWRRVVGATDRALGEALGQEYVKEYFPPAAKAAALRMVNNLIQALHDDLETLDWMSEPTRKQALAKLDAITKKIGYPDKWIDYSALKIDRGPYVLNSLRAREFDFNRRIRRIDKPTDRGEWGMTPPTVNAYYNPTRNEIVFPAGILQPPFYDPQADDAMNYGGIGSVIGHEMTHGFDDSGSKFDAKGNLKNWWSPEDLKNFQARAECVVNQFDGYTVQGDLHENGKLVAGESIADLGGVTIAYRALEKALAGKPKKEIDGFTPEQRFFLAWAQVWAMNTRPEFERLRLNTDPHPLAQFRVDGPLSNLPEFAAAFGCKAGDPMIRPPAQQCRIW
ncbi:MAG TPA: M13 family metallopeptidase [Blastocatellia bacterium]